jgi:Tol biopolymer transport system component
MKATNFTNVSKVYSLKWSPDSKYIIFDYSKEDARSIARVEVESGNVDFLLQDIDIDFRSPVYSKDGSSIFFASDKTGIFNIYKK